MTTPPPTPQLGLIKATPNDSMANFETYLNGNWDKISATVVPPSGTTLPQSGNFKVGDRFYRTSSKSIYILIVKDANWGWHWRPVHDAISPWLTVPATALDITGWTLNPTPTNPLAIAYDNRGKCYWRGVIGTSTGNISRNVSHSPFKVLPEGLRPAYRGIYMLGHETVAVGTVATNLNAWQGARIYIPDNSASISIRCFGGTADFNRVYLNGNVSYAVGNSRFTTP